MRIATVWLARAFSDFGAFRASSECEIIERAGYGLTVRIAGRTLGVPNENIAGVEYSTDEETALAESIPPKGKGEAVSPLVEPQPVTVHEPRPVPETRGRRR